jgi:hypothetical protein
MRVWIGRLFGGPAPAPEAAPAPAPAPPVLRDVAETTTDSVPVTYMRSDVPEIDSAFGYGHLDGRRGVPPENFRDFIAYKADGEGLDQLIRDVREREQSVRTRAEAVRQQRADLAKRAEELRGLAAREDEALATLREARAEQDRARTDAETHRGTGSWVQATIYLAAGALFIFGDVVMARSIVADALNMEGNEAWVFAFGLAMVSILIKPAYDRLFEKPYRNGNVRRFAWAICILAGLSFVTLGVLGAFRSEAYGNGVRLERLTDDGTMAADVQAKQLSAIEDAMLGSKLGFASFILSGILFAAAGAVTLSIGFGYAGDARAAWNANRAVKATRKHDDKVRNRHGEIRAQATARRGDLEHLSALLVDVPQASALDAEADQLHAEWRELEAQRIETRKHALRSLYDDGYELGTVMARDAAQGGAGESPRRRRPRPFVALRRAIREAALQPQSLN